jgi:hypothetical protein
MDKQSKRNEGQRHSNGRVGCKNCGHEYHEGPLFKDMQDGDGKTVTIEVCKQGR